MPIRSIQWLVELGCVLYHKPVGIKTNINKDSYLKITMLVIPKFMKVSNEKLGTDM